MGVGCASKEINTAIGCVPYGDLASLSQFLLGWSIAIAGGVAFILIAIAGFQIITSAGEPKKLQAGKELLVAALSGLFMLISSGFILRIFGVNILGIFT